MIKFIREKRQNLLSEGKTAKYLKYAIGEIALVMIGILLALQVDNWNENRKEDKTELLYLENILNDLNDQLISIEEQTKGEWIFFEDSKDILENYQATNTLKLDSIFFAKATKLTFRKTFVINDPTFTDLISSGNIKLIKDPVKKGKIIKYYQDLNRIATIIQNNNSSLIDGSYSPVYFKHGYYAASSFEFYKLALSNFQISNDLIKQSDRLGKLSLKTLSSKDELELVNVISQRHVIAVGHINFMNVLKKSTQSLIQTLRSNANN